MIDFIWMVALGFVTMYSVTPRTWVDIIGAMRVCLFRPRVSENTNVNTATGNEYLLSLLFVYAVDNEFVCSLSCVLCTVECAAT